jgi:hypothetical protein
VPANGAADGSSSGEAGTRSRPEARSTTTPPSDTGSSVPFSIRTVIRRAGPAMLPGPVAVPSMATRETRDAETPSPTWAAASSATAGRLGGGSSTFPVGPVGSGVVSGVGAGVGAVGAATTGGAVVVDAVVSPAAADGVRSSSPPLSSRLTTVSTTTTTATAAPSHTRRRVPANRLPGDCVLIEATCPSLGTT